MNNIKFTGIMPALVTPFEKDNKTVNVKVAEDLIDLFIEQGANGFYILGGTGEGLVMDAEARKTMWEVSVKHINGRKPAICHVASVNLDEATELAKHAEKTGADAIAAIPPVFFHYNETDIYNYYKALANSVHIPVIIYYHPGAQGVMTAELISKIYEIDNVTGVKWSSTDFYQLMLLKEKTHGEMNIINGPDELLVSGLAAGADAGIGSTYNMMLPQFVKIYNDFKAGRHEEALETQLKVNKVIEVIIRNEVIPAVKCGMTLMGYEVGDATYPMRKFAEEEKAKFELELKQCGWPMN